jgi:hypothetical protein
MPLIGPNEWSAILPVTNIRLGDGQTMPSDVTDNPRNGLEISHFGTNDVVQFNLTTQGATFYRVMMRVDIDDIPEFAHKLMEFYNNHRQR